jgi:hypothetical protein
VNSSAGAQRLAAQQTYVAAIVSDGLSAIQTAALGRLVAEHNSAATLVGMVAGPADGVAAGTYTVQLEKPFELSRLARLLGVSEREISSG